MNGTGYFNRYTSQRCGSFEMDGIFYHDAKVCELRLHFDEAGEHLKVRKIKNYNSLRHSLRIIFNNLYAITNKTVTLTLPTSVDFEIMEMNFEGYDIEKTEQLSEKAGMRSVKYKISNTPSYHKLEQLLEHSCAHPHLLILIKSYESSGEHINLINDVDDLYHWYHTMISASSLSPGLAKITNRITEKALSDSAKIAAVYIWVQDKIRYIAF